jgi:hypothetical protein
VCDFVQLRGSGRIENVNALTSGDDEPSAHRILCRCERLRNRRYMDERTVVERQLSSI